MLLLVVMGITLMGIIKISENFDALPVHTTYYISENRIKREQKISFDPFSDISGIVVDLIKNNVTIYEIKTKEFKKYKTELTLKEFDDYINNNQLSTATPPYSVENVFINQKANNKEPSKKDFITIKNYVCNYHSFTDKSKTIKLEIYDTDAIKIKRELLEAVVPYIPKHIEFPLVCEITYIGERDLPSLTNNKLINKSLKKSFKVLENTFNPKKTLLKIEQKELNDSDFKLPKGEYSHRDSPDFSLKKSYAKHSSWDFD